MSMSIVEVGVPTFSTRVEAWECDHNQHWNVRQYMRCFMQASFVAADRCGYELAAHPVFMQHTRYHRELLQMAPVVIRSAVLADGPFSGSAVHILSSNGRLSATALERSANYKGLPEVASKDVALALPRGVEGNFVPADESDRIDAELEVEHGFVQPRELDHRGCLSIDFLMGRIATASNDLLNAYGFTAEYSREHKISRMGVETKITRLQHIPLGAKLKSFVRLSHIASKNVVLRHAFYDAHGTALATADQSLVTVDMTTRRATELPEFMKKLADAR